MKQTVPFRTGYPISVYAPWADHYRPSRVQDVLKGEAELAKQLEHSIYTVRPQRLRNITGNLN